jgi:hypothetical protein
MTVCIGQVKQIFATHSHVHYVFGTKLAYENLLRASRQVRNEGAIRGGGSSEQINFTSLRQRSARNHSPFNIPGLPRKEASRQPFFFLYRIAKGSSVSSTLDLGDLGHRVIGPGMSVVVHRLMRHRYPLADQPPSAAKQLIERRAKLPAHGAVQDEVDGRVYERQDVYYVAYRTRK